MAEADVDSTRSIPDASSEEEEELDVSAVIYQQACTQARLSRCSKWWRACATRQTEVSLRHYGLGLRGGVPLGLSLAANSSVRYVDLGDNGMGSEGVCAVLKALGGGGAPALQTLALNKNQAGPEGATAVGTLLSATASHPLRHLDFSSNAIGDRGAASIAEGLGENKTLVSLALDDNGVDIEGAEMLAAALKAQGTSGGKLESLSLEWNSVRAEGGRAIAHAIRGQPRLVTLNLGWNGLCDDGVAALANALTPEARANLGQATTHDEEGALLELRLHHNRVTGEGAGSIAFILTTLKLLDVSGNPLGSAGAAALLLAQQSSALSEESLSPPGPDAAAPRLTCQLVAHDVCVRPETKLDGFLRRAAAAEAIDPAELEEGGISQQAAPALGNGVEAMRVDKARKKKVKPPSRLKGADVSSTDDDASSYTSNATTSRRSTPSASFRSAPSDADGAKQGKRGGSKEAGDWRRTDARPVLAEAEAGAINKPTVAGANH